MIYEHLGDNRSGKTFTNALFAWEAYNLGRTVYCNCGKDASGNEPLGDEEQQHDDENIPCPTTRHGTPSLVSGTSPPSRMRRADAGSAMDRPLQPD